MCFGKIDKFPVFSLTDFFCHFPFFGCAVGTLSITFCQEEERTLDISLKLQLYDTNVVDFRSKDHFVSLLLVQ